MTQCPRCAIEFEPSIPAEPPGPVDVTHCPQCQWTLNQPTSPIERASDPIRSYFKTVWQILREPSRFFRDMPLTSGISGPLAFAVITHWIGTSLQFLWKALLGGALRRSWNDLVKLMSDVGEIDSPGSGAMLLELQDRALHWFWGTGSIIIDPFLTLAQIVFTSLLVFIGARLWVTPGKDGAPAQITFESAVRIVSFGMTPSILAGIPIAGPLLAWILTLVITVIGAHEVYRVSWGRSIVVALFPKFLMFGLIIVAFLALFATLLGVIGILF